MNDVYLFNFYMNIPFFNKENPYDCGCAPVCLQMALGYFGFVKKIKQIYKDCESLGESHYTLPWGICLGASKAGLYSIMISKNPKCLSMDSRKDISTVTGLTIQKVEQIEKGQIKRAKKNNLIKFLDWKEKYAHLPAKILKDRKEAIVIPTIWLGTQPHNIVLVNYETQCKDQSGNRNGIFYYYDPNLDETFMTMSEKEFFKKWINKNTDNDLLIISKNELLLDEIM